MKKLFITVFFLGSLSMFTKAQIGVNTETPQATLHVVPQSVGATTAEGIIAPNLTRAQLISKDGKYLAAHIGTYVYVTVIDGIATPKTANVVAAGYYYFDGYIWQTFNPNPESLYLPSFNLPMTSVGTGKTYDLYNNVYKAQFTKAGNTMFVSSNSALTQIPVLYAASQLDFVVTYYDAAVVKVNSISAAGVINYNVLSTNPSQVPFMNIVLVVKK